MTYLLSRYYIAKEDNKWHRLLMNVGGYHCQKMAEDALNKACNGACWLFFSFISHTNTHLHQQRPMLSDASTNLVASETSCTCLCWFILQPGAYVHEHLIVE